tara:strand:+ start:504 stop:1886 length:1383 start_codon:yes stop_codon:yes gene_type:complete
MHDKEIVNDMLKNDRKFLTRENYLDTLQEKKPEILYAGWRQGDEYPEEVPTCIVPWTSITLSANGDIKPCCKFTSDRRIARQAGREYNSETEHMNIYEGHTLEDAWKGFEDIRQQMLRKEKPQGCQDCWKNERTAGVSRRQWMFEKIVDKPHNYTSEPPMNLKHMDLNFGNTCNLKCRMCGSWGSTHWFKEDKKLQQINPQFDRQLQNSTVRSIDPSVYKNMEDKLSQMERIDFKGGEPLMQDGMFEVLEMLVANDSAPNVTLGYTTNGTRVPEKLKKLWPHFKRVILNISIEATGDLYQYIRGSNVQTIEQLEQNLKWYDQFDNISGNFSIAISIYNIFDLQNLADWIEQVTLDLDHWWYMKANRTSDSPNWYEKPNQFVDIVSKPAYLDINNMPPHIKQRVLDKWDGNYHSMDYIRTALENPKYKEKEWELFKHFTRELDRIRGTNVLDYIPELEGEF